MPLKKPPYAAAKPSNDLPRRLGRFRISRTLLLDAPAELLGLFGLMIIVEAHMRWETDSAEYLAMSPRFELVPEGCAAPYYNIAFLRDPTGTRIDNIEIDKGALE